MNLLDTTNLKQLGMLALILLLCFTVANMMFVFLPGALGAVTMYILMRSQYLKLVYIRKWKTWTAATLFVFAAVIIFITPIYLLCLGIIPKFNNLLSENGQLEEIVNAIIYKLRSWHLPVRTNSEQQILALLQNLASSAPVVLGATFNFISNALLAFFFLYFMLVQGRQMEEAIKNFMPLKRTNVNELWDATRVMVKSNAFGIPILAASQALVAIIGYWIFGIKSFIFWGLLTGVFSIVPLIGCAVIWIPLCVYLMVSGQTGHSLGLAAYSFAITGSIDNILRFTILKKLGDVHPVVTMVGVIVGVPLFGFMGFIFGPLLISYLILLIKVYRVEFSSRRYAQDNAVKKAT